MNKQFLILTILFSFFIGCSKSNKNKDESSENATETETAKDEVWKQFMKMQVSTMEKMRPDSGCILILNHKNVSYYKFNKLVFNDELYEYMKNDSLIVYRITNQPLIQIGYNRKDSVVLLTTDHPEGGGNPKGEMQFFARKVEAATPFNQ
jgi:hypothetical protein